MSELRLETLTLPAAALGPENPLPALQAIPSANTTFAMLGHVPPEETTYLGWNILSPVLPYRLQDGYDRRRRPRGLRAAVLENEHLRATFVLELGGRLWSLWHKGLDRELLHANPVFQPANLAVRNAWFSGGVEWNSSVVGHTPLTCSPLFVERLSDPARGPVLRLYEWDRIRGQTYQIDAYLPDGSPLLLVRVVLSNPWPQMMPTYWWSNIAVDETPRTRVIVPAERAFKFDYGYGLRWVSIPEIDGVDVSYPARIPTANDCFFRIPDGQRPWIAAIGADGRGLVQTSTQRLRGRKLFVWGAGPGGARWQEFLSVKGSRYLEIQAGLGRTQCECIPIPGQTSWEWLEGYGLAEVDPRAGHSPVWRQAVEAVAASLEGQRSHAWMEAELAATAGLARQPGASLEQTGSAWAALEARRREKAGEPPLAGPWLRYEAATPGAEQEPWASLLEKGAMSARAVSEEPGAFMTQAEWRALLEASIRSGGSDHWLGHYHLGVMRYVAGDAAGAEAAWRTSLARQPSAWAVRNLAVLAQQRGERKEAAALYRQASALLPTLMRLAAETAAAMLAAGEAADIPAFLATLPAQVADHPRLLAARIESALAGGDLDLAGPLLDRAIGVELVDLREGEVALSDMWFRYHEQRLARAEGLAVDDRLRARVRRECPPPAHIDFRMDAKAS